MSTQTMTTPEAVPSFWTRMASVFEDVGGSPRGRLERHVRQLEDEVERLTAATRSAPNTAR